MHFFAPLLLLLLALPFDATATHYSYSTTDHAAELAIKSTTSGLATPSTHHSKSLTYTANLGQFSSSSPVSVSTTLFDSGGVMTGFEGSIGCHYNETTELAFVAASVAPVNWPTAWPTYVRCRFAGTVDTLTVDIPITDRYTGDYYWTFTPISLTTGVHHDVDPQVLAGKHWSFALPSGSLTEADWYDAEKSGAAEPAVKCKTVDHTSYTNGLNWLLVRALDDQCDVGDACTCEVTIDGTAYDIPIEIDVQ